MALLKEKEYYTYADYCEWDDSERWELIDGVAYAMAPPSILHQGVSGELFIQLGNFLRGKTCKVFTTPGVRLNMETTDDTVLIPDIVVVCDQAKISKAAINGAPDLVIEILSPSTARFDLYGKFQQYKKAGVLEYWIVNPEIKTVSAYALHNGEYIASVYGDEDTAPVRVLEGCEIDLSLVFAD
ncbi:MAG: Uma2 family endonuclease [Oscillospiraceae bacterium]|nr:Uma2 family endonuclease [Oscillospiraceae bacterium]